MVAVTLPPDTTLWAQGLVHSGRHVYGLSLHYGEPRVPGLWRASVDGGAFSLLRFLSDAGECRLPLNSFELSDGALRAKFFCPAGCDASPCLAGRIHDETGTTMPYQGELESEWKPLLGRGARGVVDRFRYRIDEIRLPAESESGRLLLRRDDHPFRGREPSN